MTKSTEVMKNLSKDFSVYKPSVYKFIDIHLQNKAQADKFLGSKLKQCYETDLLPLSKDKDAHKVVINSIR